MKAFKVCIFLWFGYFLYSLDELPNFEQLDNGVRATLIINESGVGGGCFWFSVFRVRCKLVVVRIYAYRLGIV
jgi:hypothetical protein